MGLWRTARRLTFFRLRRERLRRAWTRIMLAGLSLALAWTLQQGTAPIPPSQPAPTRTLGTTMQATQPTTPGVRPSPTPTATPSPAITPTPSLTPTPTPLGTPMIPTEIFAEFTGTLTPPPEPRFSPIVFTTRLDFKTYRPLNPGEVFQNPIRRMYGVFTYDGMLPGVQWTALWYRNGQLVYYETKPWDGGTGGYGYTEWAPPPEAWLPGTYTVYLFVGTKLVQSGSFRVEGLPPTPTFTPTPTPLPTATPTPAPTSTPTPTPTPSPTRTPFPATP